MIKIYHTYVKKLKVLYQNFIDFSQIQPLKLDLDEAVNEASANMIEKHHTSFEGEEIIAQVMFRYY